MLPIRNSVIKKELSSLLWKKLVPPKKLSIAGDQFCKTTSAVTTVADYVESGAGGASTTTSSAVVGTASACTCTFDLGSEPASNACTGLTNAASPFKTCTDKDDGSGSQKCCLLTFNAVPKYNSNNIKVAAKGS